jgi:hypothetical protein
VSVAAGAASFGALAGQAHAAPMLLQNDVASVSLAPFTDQTALGGRAVVDAKLDSLETSFSAAVEYDGGNLSQQQDVWAALHPSAPWKSNEVNVRANWAFAPDAGLSVEAGERQRWMRDAADWTTPDPHLTSNGTRFLRIQAKASAASQLDLDAGAETSTATLDAQAFQAAANASTRFEATSSRVFAHLSWRPWSKLSLQAGQAAEDFTIAWRGGDTVSSQATYMTPSAAIVLTPWEGAEWRLDAEKTVQPIDPAQFVTYAGVAAQGEPSAMQPSHGWRTGLRLAQTLGSGAKVSAEATDWRLASVTDDGPVGSGEAPTSIGPGERQQLAVSFATPLSVLGLRQTTLQADASVRRSRVIDPFTGQPRPLSGETPYGASLRLGGAFLTSDLTWSVVAKADGPQSLYDMSQVTSLGATTGVGGAVTYGLGPVRMSLEVDNLVGGGRDVTTYSYAGSRSLGTLSDVVRRRDEARAVRFALRQPL